MVIKLDKKIEVIKSDEPVNLPLEIQKQIDAFWEKQVQANPHLFNGEVWTVTKCEDLPDSIRMCIQKSSYSHYLYDERVGLEGQRACYNLNCGILLETIDGYYIVGEMAPTTSYARLHFIEKCRALEVLKSLDNPKRPYLEDLIRLDSQKEKDFER